MSAIRCHFDGKVIIPDEPVDLPIDQPLFIRVDPGVVIVEPEVGNGTAAELRESGMVGIWKHRSDIVDSVEYARELRRRAEGREAQS